MRMPQVWFNDLLSVISFMYCLLQALVNDWVCGTCVEANRFDALECLTCGQQKSDGYVLDTVSLKLFA